MSDFQVAPKKRGRKPKAETLATAAALSKPGRLNIAIVKEEEDDAVPVKQDSIPEVQEQENLSEHLSVAPVTINVNRKTGTKLFLEQERRPACSNRPGYFHLLHDFVEVYPHKTDIACWWCCHTFTSHPVGIPMHYDANLDAFKVVGCFCSLNCAYAHVRKENMKIHPSEFRFMYLKMTGSDVCESKDAEWKLEPAPERYLLKKFGGPLTIEEYRLSFHNHYDVMFTPMMPFGMLCDEILGKSLTRGWTKDGIRRPLEIRKAKKNHLQSETSGLEKIPGIGKLKQRTTVTQMISFDSEEGSKEHGKTSPMKDEQVDYRMSFAS